jgi:TPR repeat protein
MILTLSSSPIQATPIDSCMEEKCILYFNKWKIKANAKRVLAISALAELYYNGHGTEKDLSKSIRYFRKASRYKFAYAQYRTGVFYLMEKGFIDNERGINYLKKAAKNGHTEAAFLLGVIFGTGDLGIKDVGESDKWLEKALKMNHPVAQKYADYLYRSGQVNNGHYMKVNNVITESNVTTVSKSTLGELFDYDVANFRATPSATSAAKDTIGQGRNCEQIFSCYKIDREGFWRYVKKQSSSVSQ